MFISHKIYPVREHVLHVRSHVPPKRQGHFFKDQELSQKDHSLCKNFKTFLKKLEEFSENFKVFSKGTLQPFIIALNFHISFINRGLALF